jgi:outer membrane receptor protein involved in Fe transport
MNLFKLTPIALVTGLMASGGYAQEYVGNNVGEVVVSATRTDRSITNVPASVTVVDRQQIQDNPGNSIEQVLQDVPGMETNLTIPSYSIHPTYSFPGMMGPTGGQTSNVLVMVDGVPINDAFMGDVQWTRVPKSDIERVEVVRGGGATLWGTFALSGVVDIVTRAPTKKEATADVGYGNNGTFQGNVYGTPIFNDALKVSLSYNKFQTDGYPQNSGQPVPGYFVRPSSLYGTTSFNSDVVGLTGNYKIDSSLYGKVRLNYTQASQDNMYTLPMTTSQNYANLSFDVNKDLGDNGLITAAAFLNQGTYKTNNQSYNDAYYGSCYGGPYSPACQGGSYISNAQTVNTTDYGASVVWKNKLSEFIPSFLVGADAKQVQATGQVSAYQPVNPNDQSSLFPATYYDAANSGTSSGMQQFLGVFTQASFFPNDKLEIMPSIRLQQWNNTNGSMYLPNTIGPLTTWNAGSQPNKTANDLSWRISARQELSTSTALRAAAYKSFNAPTLSNLYYTYSAGTYTQYSNPNLNPENLYGGEVGLDFKTQNTSSSATAFYNEIHNFFGTGTDGNGNYQTANIGTVRSQGLMFNTGAQLTKYISGNLNYTYTDSQLVSSMFPGLVITGQQQSNVPKNKANITLTYKQDQFRTSLIGQYQSQSFGQANNPAYIGYTGANISQQSFQQPSYFILNGSAAYAFTKTTELYVNANNLLNLKYVANNDGWAPPLYGTPRSIFAGVRLKFD